jgi:hypothetical protein
MVKNSGSIVILVITNTNRDQVVNLEEVGVLIVVYLSKNYAVITMLFKKSKV